jgi:heat shock protein HslJ
MEGEGTIDTLIVARFEHVWPEERCEKISVATPLIGTHWKLVALNGAAVEPHPDRRQEAYLRFELQEGRVTGFAGCNTINGSYETNEDSLNFGLLATTMMACPRLDRETEFLKTLEGVQRFSILGESLVLSDGGSDVARFRATDPE